MTDQVPGGGETLPPVLAPAETPEALAWPYYEARLSVHVRGSKPTSEFFSGGEELAHARSWTQAPDFPSAVSRLDADLAKNWSAIMTNAALVDMEPSLEVAPKRTPWIAIVLEVRLVVVVLTVLLVVLQSLALVFT